VTTCQRTDLICYTFAAQEPKLTFILLTWRIWWAPNNASEWQMGFNLAFKWLMTEYRLKHLKCNYYKR